MNGKKWLEEETALLIKNCNNKNIEELCNLFPDRTKCSIKSKIDSLHINRGIISKWTEEEINILIKYYPLIGATKLHEKFINRSIRCIAQKAFTLGLSYLDGIKKSTKWTLEEINILKDNYFNMGLEVSKLLPGRTKASIKRQAVKRKFKSKKYNTNLLFEWNADFSYYLGLILSDGHIGKNNYSITINLKNSYSEEKLLNELKERLGFGKIYYKKNKEQIVYQVTNKSLHQDLISKFNIRSNKTWSLGFPRVPSDFFVDFVRGFFDGDGSVFLLKRENKLFTSIVCGDRTFLEKLLKKLKKVTKIQGGCVCKSKSIFQLSFGYKDTLLFRNFLYKTTDNLKLERKFIKFYSLDDK